MTIKELTAALDGEHTDLGEINKKLDALLETEAEKERTTAEEEAAAADIEQPEAPADSESEAPGLGDSMNTDGEVNEDAR